MSFSLRFLTILTLVSIAVGLTPTEISAQPEIPSVFDAPWVDTPPHRDGDAVVAAAVGIADERLTRMGARRADARRSATERARAMLVAWLIDGYGGPESERAQWVREHATVSRVRPLSDGGAVVELRLPLEGIERNGEPE